MQPEAVVARSMTGKETALPAPERRWPAADFTRSPDVKG
jgi:hypothetical protein